MVKGLLLNMMEELGRTEFQRFQWYLAEEPPNRFENIPWSRLEDASRDNTITMMVQFYGSEGSVEISKGILRKMRRNDLVEMLQFQSRSAAASASAEAPPTLPHGNGDYLKGHKERTYFKNYACKLTLDPNTAHRNLMLSENNTKLTRVKEDLPYSYSPSRFDHHQQVLCREALTGRCYWEVEWKDVAVIGVAYAKMNRKGEGRDSGLGENDMSWVLFCASTTHCVRHNGEKIDLPLPSSPRVGVYLDWPGGTLSFYKVSHDSLTHIHTFHSRFTEPLYPGFFLWGPGCSVSLC